jgi:hypothetical protein
VVALAAGLAWASSAGPYGLASPSRDVAWRIDRKTGAVSVCRAVSLLRAPVCSPFGADPAPAPSTPQAGPAETSGLP